MKPFDDGKHDARVVVRRGYDMCAEAYSASRTNEEEPILSQLHSTLKPGSRALDLGCGSGIPVTSALARKYDTVGIDISVVQVEMATTNVPNAEIVLGDMSDLPFDDESFDAVVSFYALFHVPKREQLKVFNQIHSILKTGGYLLATLAMRDEASYTEDDFFGTTMYWSNYGFEHYLAMLEELDFAIIQTGEIGHGNMGDFEDEVHPHVFARKR